MAKKKEEEKLYRAGIVDDTALAWHDHIIKFKQETPKRVEEAAKFFSGLICATLTFFLSFNNGIFLFFQSIIWVKVALIFWLLSIATCFFVVFPFNYKYIELSSDSIVETHEKMVRRKRSLLMVSLMTYLIALASLSYIFVVVKPLEKKESTEVKLDTLDVRIIK